MSPVRFWLWPYLKRGNVANEIQGFFYAIAAATCYAMMGCFIKLLSSVPIETIVFFRHLVGFFILVLFFRTGESIRSKKHVLHSFRALSGFIALSCFTYAIRHLSVVEAILLFNTAPLFIPLIVLIWFNLKIPKRRIYAIALGFIGVVLVLKPSLSFINIAGLLGLTAGIMVSIALVVVRQLSKTEPTFRILFYFFFYILLLSFFPFIFTWEKISDPKLWLYLLCVGVLSFAYQFMVTKAYSKVPATRVGPMVYFALIFAGIFDWMIWKVVPDISFLGIALIVGGSILVLMEKDKRQLAVKKFFE